MFSFIRDFFDSEPTDAQLDTLYILSKKVFIHLYGHTPSEASELAVRSVNRWIDKGTTTQALKMLWKGKIA